MKAKFLGFLVCSLLFSDVPEVRSVRRTLNTIDFALGDGYAQIVWLNAAAIWFRYGSSQFPQVTSEVSPVFYSIEDTAGAIQVASPELTVRVQRRPLALSLRNGDGELLLNQRFGVKLPGDGAHLVFSTRPGERFFGLGPRAGLLNLQSRIIDSSVPLLLAESGYGIFWPSARALRFDIGATREMDTIVSGAFAADYCFYTGSSLKEVLERHHETCSLASKGQSWVQPQVFRSNAPIADLGKVTAETLIPRLLHAALSGILAPRVSTEWLNGLRATRRRQAEVVVATMPHIILHGDTLLGSEAMNLRRKLEPHLRTYLAEATDRGLPVIHPLNLQFPYDKRSADIVDQFLLGDEMMIAPVPVGAQSRRVYLPPGLWTELNRNRLHRGRRSIELTGYGRDLPIFLRGGSILPLQAQERMELHYFPKLAAEYFLTETQSSGVTQIHAAPALADLRLQIEEQVGKNYQWVIHHVRLPEQVVVAGTPFVETGGASELQAGQWRYDTHAKKLYICARVEADEDWIAYVTFPQESWFLSPP